MSKAYALLGILFAIVLVGAYIAVERAEAPSPNVESAMSFTLSSPAFENNGAIPSEYTCDGPNTSPEFRIEGVPEGTKSLVLLADDPDIPAEIKETRGIEQFDHFVLYNIPPETEVIPAGKSVGTEGLSSRGEPGYVGPCPPSEYEPTEHRYFFRLYALSGELQFIKAPTLAEVETAMEGMVIESTELMGRYERIK